MSNNLNVISGCEVCGNTNLNPVLDLGMHPLCDDLVEIGDEKICAEYPIEILFCENCATAHQKYQVPKHDLFPVSYHYRSRFTADVLKGMEGLVDSCEKYFGKLDGSVVLDIGCNDGSLLEFFRNKGADTIGIEPTAACEDANERGHTTYNDYLTPEVAEIIVKNHGQPDYITFTNVFAHIEDLNSVLESLSILMSDQTVIIIENHYLGAVFDGNQFDTFYHEHPRTYSYTSFIQMAKSLNVNLLNAEFPSRYGGNIRIFMGNRSLDNSNTDTDKILQREKNFLAEFKTLNANMNNWRKTKKLQIDNLVQMHGKLIAKAFPGRAAILVKLLDLTEEDISVVYEKPGSLKYGHYLPGTRIPISSDDELFSLHDKDQPILNLAWHISAEIRKYLTKNGYTGDIIDILSPDDFKSD